MIERGSTANGEFVRFSDGTQICAFVVDMGDITAAGSGTWSNSYRTLPDFHWTFPAVFVATPIVLGRAIPPADASAVVERRRAAVSLGRSNTTACYQIHIYRVGDDATSDVFEAEFLAVGRWF